MFKPLNKAYSAGWRAGLSHGNTTNDCPFKWWDFLRAGMWHDGWESAMRYKLNLWLGKTS